MTDDTGKFLAQLPPQAQIVASLILAMFVKLRIPPSDFVVMALEAIANEAKVELASSLKTTGSVN